MCALEWLRGTDSSGAKSELDSLVCLNGFRAPRAEGRSTGSKMDAPAGSRALPLGAPKLSVRDSRNRKSAASVSLSLSLYQLGRSGWSESPLARRGPSNRPVATMGPAERLSSHERRRRLTWPKRLIRAQQIAAPRPADQSFARRQSGQRARVALRPADRWRLIDLPASLCMARVCPAPL